MVGDLYCFDVLVAYLYVIGLFVCCFAYFNAQGCFS